MIIKFANIDEFMDELEREDEILGHVRSSVYAVTTPGHVDCSVVFRAGFVGNDGILRCFEQDCGEDVSGGASFGSDEAITMQMQLNALCDKRYLQMRSGWYEVD